MTEIVLAVLVIGCIIYFLKGDFFKRNVAVTVLQSLPLPILKKWIKEDKNKNGDIKDKKSNIKAIDDKNESESTSNELDEISIDILEENKSIESENEPGNIAKIDVLENNIENEEVNNIIQIEEVYELTENEDTEVELSIENIFLDQVSCDSLDEEILVYWTPKGKTYHGKSTCRTLARSKIINCGTISESGKDFKCEHCK